MPTEREPLEGDQPHDLYRWWVAEAARLDRMEGLEPETAEPDPADVEHDTHLLSNLRDALYALWRAGPVIESPR